MEAVNVVMAALFLAVILFILFQTLLRPLKIAWKILLNSLIGLLLLLIFNYFGPTCVYYSYQPYHRAYRWFSGHSCLILLICFQCS